MRLTTLFCTAAALGLLVAASALAQNPPAGARRGGGMFGMMQDQFQQTLAALGDLNLRPDFNLTKDQKEKLQAIRDEVKKAEDKWRADNADALKKIQEDMQAAMQGQDQDKMRETMTKRRELMQTQPKTDDAAAKVKALLTPDEAKALEIRITERQEEMRSRMGGMGMRRGGGQQ